MSFRLVDAVKKKIIISRKSFFSISHKRQLNILNSFSEPKDNIDRSFFQYKCQKKTYRIIENIILQTFGFLKIILYRGNKNPIDLNNRNVDAIFLSSGVTTDIITASLKKTYDNIEIVSFSNNRFFNKDVISILYEVKKRHKFSFYFRHKVKESLAEYAYIINKYNPKSIITHNELSFSSSILTEFCKRNNVNHLNVMHGEKLFYIRDSFFCFDKFYVWDNHYVELFSKLRACPNQFIVENVQSNLIKIEKNSHMHRMTYYLSNKSARNYIDIRDILLQTRVESEKIAIRYHPRTKDLELIKKIFKGFVIENPNTTSLKESLSKTFVVISLFSTVLFQAYVSKLNYIIDDLSSPSFYKKLEKLDYIMLKKTPKLLSEYIREVNDEHIIDS